MLRSEPFYAPVFYRGDSNYRNSIVSFCNTALLLISEFFPAPLAKQKEARYNMPKRTKMVMFKKAQAWLFPITRLILTVSHKEQIGELYPQVLETLVYGACRELFE